MLKDVTESVLKQKKNIKEENKKVIQNSVGLVTFQEIKLKSSAVLHSVLALVTYNNFKTLPSMLMLKLILSF